MELGKQKSSIEIKECVVQLERLEMGAYKDDSSDSDDLPILPFTFSSTRKKLKSKKSSAELLKEHQNLARNIKGDTESVINIEEAIRRLETVQVVATEDRSSETPDSPAPTEENDEKILNVKDSLQFFNSYDVTPDQCGYKNRCHDSFPVHIFEQKMLSFKRVEFEHVISSFLYAVNESCISDLKSFITFLLRTLSIHNDTTCVIACYRVLVSLLNKHPESSCLTFSSAEIFMLLFNHGVDIDIFKFLPKWTNIKKKLEVPQYQKKNSCGIPNDWLFNLKYMLKALIEIISSCTFKEKDIEQIFFFFIWMAKDSLLLKENLYPIVQKCINVCLENIKEEKWNKTLCNIINAIMSMEEFSVMEKWSNIYHITKSLPIRGLRAIQLRKQISFFSLKCLCLGSNQNLNEECLNFNIDQLKSLLKQLIEIDSNLLKFASKFIDGCVENLNASKEEYNELCNLLKKCEACLSDQNEQTHFCKIYSKLRTFCGRKVSIHERSSMYNLLTVKSEYGSNQEVTENDSRVIDKNRNSFIPYFSEDSQSCSTNQSDHANLFPDVNGNNVHIKSEYTDEACASERSQKSSSVKILIRKKRSSRSSSGNGLMDPNLVNSDLNSKDEDLLRQSPEFECELLNEDLSSRKVDVQNNTVDLALPGPDIVISDFSVEYPEDTCNSVKVEPEQYNYDHVPLSSESEKMGVVDCENLTDKLPHTPENDVNQNLVADDLSPLFEICEVKSIAPSNMDDMENSSLYPPVLHSETTSNLDIMGNPPLFTSNLHCETTSTDISKKTDHLSSSLENPLIKENSVQRNESEHEIISYAGAVLDASAIQENITTVLNQGTSSSSTPQDNVLDADEDIVFIEETISPKKLSKKDKIEENIPSPIQRYSRALPEISITPVQNVPSSSVACSNSLTDNEDILIIEEKTSVTENDDVIFLKTIMQNKNTNSNVSPKTKLQTSIVLKSIQTQVNKIASQVNILPEVEVSRTCIESQENNSDSDISLVDVIVNDIEENTSNENESSKIIDNHVVTTANESVVNISHLGNEPSSHQCQKQSDSVLSQIQNDSQFNAPNLQCEEVLNSVLKQIDVKEDTFDSQCSSPNLQCQNVLNTVLKQIDVTYDSQCNEVLKSVLETVDVSSKQHIDDTKSHSEKKYVSDLKSESNSSTGLSVQSYIVENNLEIGQENTDHSDKNAAFLPKFASNLSVEHISGSNVTDTSRGLTESPIIINRFVLESNLTKQTLESKIDASENPISDSFAIPTSKKSNSNELNNNIENQNVNNLVPIIPDINVENCSAPSAKQSHTSDTNKTQNIILDSFVRSVSERSDLNILDNSGTENQTLNKLTIIIPGNKSKNCIVPRVNSSDKSVLKCNTNNRISGSIQNLRKPLKSNIFNRNKITSASNTKKILDTLINESARAKKTVSKCKASDLSIGEVAKKSFKNERELQIIKVAEGTPVLKKNTSSYISPSSRIQRKRSWSSQCENRGDLANRSRKSPRKYSPVKSSLSEKYSSCKSPKRFCSYSHWVQKYKHFNRTAVLSKVGKNLSDVLRGQKTSSSSCNRENNISDDSDSDIIELYTDPKRYADKECLVVYESEDVVILDSD